ncbi:hypothetical protein [Arsukibacterium sp.]|uniref:hypothetical protein n=1 Tax=Arsukibacterium sp. TaxID=1977258 RepID=UPI002FDAAA3E
MDNDQGVISGVRALSLPSKAAFGRQLLAAEQPDEWLESGGGVGIGKAWVFQAEAARVDALIARLEQQFNQAGTVPYYSAGRHLAFVPHPHPYSFSHNSNHQVADWLRALGFDVTGSPALGHWRVKESVTAK